MTLHTENVCGVFLSAIGTQPLPGTLLSSLWVVLVLDLIHVRCNNGISEQNLSTEFRRIFALTDLIVQVYLCHKYLPVSMNSQVGVF